MVLENIHITQPRIDNAWLQPIFTQSGSLSRKRPVSTINRLFFDWILLVLLIVVDFIVFTLFLQAVGVREYRCMAVENRLAALCFARSPRATRAPRATNPRPSGLVALGLAEAAKATFVALHSAESRPS